MLNLYADILTQEEKNKLTKIINNDLPKKIDDITYAVDFYIAENKMVYSYEMNYIQSVNDFNPNLIINRMDNAMCTYPPLRNLIDRGIILKYVYRNKETKKYIFSFEITKKECNLIQ